MGGALLFDGITRRCLMHHETRLWEGPCCLMACCLMASRDTVMGGALQRDTVMGGDLLFEGITRHGYGRGPATRQGYGRGPAV